MNAVAALCLLLAGSVFCSGAEYSVQTWDVDDGLPESGITDVIQSRDGYLWVSTLNSGITRFDGVHFADFEPPVSQSGASRGIRRLFAGQDGTLWMNGFGNYLASLRDGRFQIQYTNSVVLNSLVWQNAGCVVFETRDGNLLEGAPSAESNYIWKLISPPGAIFGTHFFADFQGSFWYRATNGDPYCVANGKAAIVSLPGNDSQVNLLASDQNGAIAAGTSGKLFLWNGDHFENATPTNGEPDISVKGLVSDGQGGWWVESNGRLRRCKDRKWIAEAPEWRREKRTWSRVHWEQSDKSGGFWCSYVDGGVVHISANGALSAVTTREGLPSNRVRTMTQDSEGNTWASFESGGLVRIRPRLFQAIENRDGLSDIVTTSVCEDRQGAIWIGTLGGTVSRWENGRCTNFTLPQEGTHCEMTTVFPDKQGRVWIGTHGNGLLVYENGQFRHMMDDFGMNIRGLLVTADGQVWVASQKGLYLLENGTLQRILVPKSEADYPAALAKGADGRIWAAMNSGVLVCRNGNHMTIFQPQDPAMRCRFAAVYEDAQGTVWIGTLGAGLIRFRDGRFSALTTRDGLPKDNITEVLDDGEGRLWLGSPAGIFSVQKSRIEARLDGNGEELICHAYGRDDGLPTVGCAIASQPAAWRGQDGRLWFATSKGVAYVKPSDADTVQHPPWVVLEQVRVDGQPGLPGSAAQNDPDIGPSFLSSDRQKPMRIRLAPGPHQIEFRFTGLDFDDPERIRFKYMLKGLDSTWREETTDRSANYPDIPPGSYSFFVMAENSGGEWSRGQASLILIIPPHFWETSWFRVSALASILVLVGASVFWVLQLRHNRELRALEHRHALERERVRIAQDIHDDLGASLTRITMLSQSALNKSEPVKSPMAELSRIYSTARSMTNAMDEIVWAINPSNDTLENLAAYFAEHVQEFLAPLGLKFNLDMPLTLPEWTIPSEIRHNLFLAFKEALNNVARHSNATEVVITLEIKGKGFVLSVQDNGRGFDATALAGAKDDAKRNGAGNGLINMRRRLEELGGYCVINSAPDSGTRVTLGVELKE